MDKVDKRYIRTHGEILRVFKEIIQKKEYKDITVSEIARRADVNRKTFYRHFASIYVLLEELQMEIVADLSELSDFFKRPMSLEQYRNVVRGFIEILDRNRALHKRLFCSGEYHFVFDKIRSTMTKRIEETFINPKEKESQDRILYINFFSYGFLFVVADWLSSEKPIPKDDFIEKTAGIMFYSGKGYKEIIGKP